MKDMKKFSLILITILMLILTSCADNKTFKIKGQEVTVKPYGWINKDSQYNKYVNYEICGKNIFWDVILCETIFAPILITGYELYEPESVNEQFINGDSIIHKKVYVIIDTIQLKSNKK
jgi:hypothetical protein